uniref:Ig-like domain-containing protein n=1 Tax=Mastacembelus armatus TaxID=205130 RepID=A0A3Q3M4B7_9TELE
MTLYEPNCINVVFSLFCCNRHKYLILLSGTGDVTVKVKEGDDAILPCSLSTRENIVQKLFHWRKDGQKEVFLYDAGVHYNNGRTGQDEQFRGRVSHFPDQLQFGNASIVIRNTKVTDSGNYTCDFPHLETRRLIFHISLIVGEYFDKTWELISPWTKILKVTEDGVVLQCEVRGASPKPDVKWQDSDGNVLRAEEPQVSERGGLYYVSLLTTVTKTSTNLFHCVSTQKDIGHRTEEEIYVPGKKMGFKLRVIDTLCYIGLMILFRETLGVLP